MAEPLVRQVATLSSEGTQPQVCVGSSESKVEHKLNAVKYIVTSEVHISGAGVVAPVSWFWLRDSSDGGVVSDVFSVKVELCKYRYVFDHRSKTPNQPR